jgi:hypothetical protein
MIAAVYGRKSMTGTLPILLALAVLLTGCSTYATSRYAINAETVAALRAYRPATVTVGPFTAAKPGQTEITCRAVGPIKTPDGETFEEFIRKALVAELTLAELYAPSAPVTLTGKVESINFSSGITDAAWTITLAVVSSNGRTLTVAEDYSFTSSWFGRDGLQSDGARSHAGRAEPRREGGQGSWVSWATSLNDLRGIEARPPSTVPLVVFETKHLTRGRANREGGSQ